MIPVFLTQNRLGNALADVAKQLPSGGPCNVSSVVGPPNGSQPRIYIYIYINDR